MPGSTPKLAPLVPPGMISALPAGEPGGGSQQQGAGGRTPGQGGAGGTAERTRNFGEGTWERCRCGAEVVRRKVTPPQGKQGGLALLPQPPRVLLQGSPWQRGRGSGCRAPMGAWRQPRPGHPGACPVGLPGLSSSPRAHVAPGDCHPWGRACRGGGQHPNTQPPRHHGPVLPPKSLPQNPSVRTKLPLFPSHTKPEDIWGGSDTLKARSRGWGGDTR